MSKNQQILLLVLRIVFGGLFLYAGITKLLDGFTASGYLLYATSGPFSSLFMKLAGNPVVDFLVTWGEIAIGSSLISGTLVRYSSIAGIVMMVLFYLSAFPPEHGLISELVIYALVFLVLIFFETGKFLGGDQLIASKTSFGKYV